MNQNQNLQQPADSLPLRSPEDVDLTAFNIWKGPDDKGSAAVRDIKRLFHKRIVVDDQTLLSVETIKVPGFIGISDEEQVTDLQDNTVSGYEDIIKGSSSSSQPSHDGSHPVTDEPLNEANALNEANDGSSEQPSGFVGGNWMRKGNFTTVARKGH